jgi:hypothetical protein
MKIAKIRIPTVQGAAGDIPWMDFVADKLADHDL